MFFGMPDIAVGRDGKVHTLIEVKKQSIFRVDEPDRFKLLYFAKKRFNVILVTTAG